MDTVSEIAKRAKKASPYIAAASTQEKNMALRAIADNLLAKMAMIMKANSRDIASSRQKGISDSLIDRLALDEERIKKIASSIDDVIGLTDPIGEVIFGYELPNGLTLKNIRVPLGVIGIIYEARPNVTVDASVLCLKAGSSVILRGSSSALESNKMIVEVIREALGSSGLPEDIVQVIPSADRKDAQIMMGLREYIDVLIPRGGKSLIDSVVGNSKVAVIETGIGNCHVYVDSETSYPAEKISSIIINAKTQRPSVCNAAEKLLIHEKLAQRLLPRLVEDLSKAGVEVKGCKKTAEICKDIKEATEEEWYEEFLSLKIAVKVVSSLKEAIDHINKYGSGHSDSIITSSYSNANLFTKMVDSSTVYVNASTRFTDGGEFGMGAEIGISTQKLHWRGPMGLREITTNKFIVTGEGHIRE